MTVVERSKVEVTVMNKGSTEPEIHLYVLVLVALFPDALVAVIMMNGFSRSS